MTFSGIWSLVKTFGTFGPRILMIPVQLDGNHLDMDIHLHI